MYMGTPQRLEVKRHEIPGRIFGPVRVRVYARGVEGFVKVKVWTMDREMSQ